MHTSFPSAQTLPGTKLSKSSIPFTEVSGVHTSFPSAQTLPGTELSTSTILLQSLFTESRLLSLYPPLDPPNGSLHASVITRRYQFGFLQSSWTNKRASSSERSAAAVWHRAIRNRRPQCNNPNIERIIKPRSPLKLEEAPEVGCVCGHH